MQLKQKVLGMVAVAGLWSAGLSAQTAVITFDDGWQGWNPPWTADAADTAIEPEGGNPGAYAHTTAELYDLGYYIDDIFGGESPFLGNHAEHASLTFSIDFKVDSIRVGGQPAEVPVFVHFRNFSHNASVFFRLGTLAEGQAWTTHSVTVDPRSLQMPAGWGGTGADDPETGGPVLPAGVTFADVMSDVNEVSLAAHEPYEPFEGGEFDIGVDNIRIAFGAAPPAQPPRYEIVDLGTFGGELANAHAINESGAVAGVAMNKDFIELAFLWQDGQMRYLGTLNPAFEYDFGVARGISDNGYLAGYSMAPFPNGPGTVAHAFFWSEETGMVDLAPGSEFASWAWDVNSAGQVVGEGAGAFIWTQKDGMVSIGPGAAEAINEKGEVAGWGTTPGGVGGWVYDSASAQMRYLDTLGRLSEIRDINIHGKVVSYYKSVYGADCRIDSVEAQAKGWDLEVFCTDEPLLVEVKGLVNAELVCELTPNEFEKMLHPENSARYIVYVVNNALAEAPQAPLPTVFEHRGGEKWVSQDGKKLKIRRKVGAVLTV